MPQHIYDEAENDVLISPPWIKFYQASWLKSTGDMDDDQRGWYIQLLMAAADSSEEPGYLIDDEEKLRQIAKIEDLSSDFQLMIKHGLPISNELLEIVRKRREKKWREVLRKFKQSAANPGMLFNKRMLSVVKDALKTRIAKVEGGKARWKVNKVNSKTSPKVLPYKPDSDENKLSKEHVLNSTLENNDENYTENEEKIDTTKKMSQTLNGNDLSEIDEAQAQQQLSFGLAMQRSEIRDHIKKEKTKTEKNLDDEVLDIYSFWKSEMNFDGSRLATPLRKKKVAARLREGTTVEEIKSAIRGCAKTPWYRKVCKDDLIYICQSREIIEHFINLSVKPIQQGANSNGNRFESTSAKNNREQLEVIERLQSQLQDDGVTDTEEDSLASGFGPEDF